MVYPALRRELSGGLILRNGTPDDIDRTVDLLQLAFVQEPGGLPKPECEPWARDLGSGRHPFTAPDRLVLVEDPANGKIVSCSWNIPMRWSFEGVEIGVARPEMVATHPDYRGRALTRHILGAMHERSAADGDLAQAITGILHYYRQFEYEYALELGGGRRIGIENMPRPPREAPSGFRVEPATAADVPALMELSNRRKTRSMISPVHPESYWRWMTGGINPESGLGWSSLVIRDAANAVAGFVLMRQRRFGSSVAVLACEVEDGVSWWDVRDPVLSAIATRAQQLPAMPSMHPVPLRDVSLAFGSSHPLYEVLTPELRAVTDEPYAWFMRVPDLPAFLQAIAPVLAKRLAASGFAGLTKDVVIDFYREELVLKFEDGHLREARMRRRQGLPTDAAFPRLVFLQMVFGRRSFDDLHSVMPDVWARPAARLLLDVLFPVRASCVHPIT